MSAALFRVRRVPGKPRVTGVSYVDEGRYQTFVFALGKRVFDLPNAVVAGAAIATGNFVFVADQKVTLKPREGRK
jgi:hypothetical protein